MWPRIRQKDLYLESGYFNVAALLDCGMPYNFVIGGRGTGKTFGVLKELYERRTTFMYLRRTKDQCSLISTPDFHPYKDHNKELGWNITAQKLSPFHGGFYDTVEDSEGGRVPVGNPFAYTGSLGHVAKIRGVSLSDIDVLVFDEFIPEPHERAMKEECFALMNACETIGRNRELKGKGPLQLIALTNSNDIAPDIFVQLGLVTVIDGMKRKHKSIYQDMDREMCVLLLDDSPISEMKRDTSLYRLTKGTRFSRMSLDNDFSNNYPFVHQRPLVEYSRGTYNLQPQEQRESLHLRSSSWRRF